MMMTCFVFRLPGPVRTCLSSLTRLPSVNALVMVWARVVLVACIPKIIFLIGCMLNLNKFELWTLTLKKKTLCRDQSFVDPDQYTVFQTCGNMCVCVCDLCVCVCVCVCHLCIRRYNFFIFQVAMLRCMYMVKFSVSCGQVVQVGGCQPQYEHTVAVRMEHVMNTKVFVKETWSFGERFIYMLIWREHS